MGVGEGELCPTPATELQMMKPAPVVTSSPRCLNIRFKHTTMPMIMAAREYEWQ